MATFKQGGTKGNVRGGGRRKRRSWRKIGRHFEGKRRRKKKLKEVNEAG